MKDMGQKKEAIPEHDQQEVKKRKCPVRYKVRTIRKTGIVGGEVLARRLLCSPGILKPAEGSAYRQESIRVRSWRQVAVLARCKNVLVSHLNICAQIGF